MFKIKIHKMLIFIALTGLMLVSCKKNTKNNKIENSEEILQKEPYKPEDTEVWSPQPKIINPISNNGIPSDAIVLFNGSDLNSWESVEKRGEPAPWVLNEEGSMTVKDLSGDIQTKQNFGSIQLHLEWKSNPIIKGKGQSRSNSGVFLQDRYEVQILDNNDNPTYVNGMVGSIYKQSIPLVMATKDSGEWNSYDIIYHEPKYDTNGSLKKKGTLTVLLNGVLIQDHFTIQGTTEYIGWPKNKPHGKAPIKLQDHKDQSGVSFRNIWVRELD